MSIKIIQTMAEAIRALGRVPIGHLYAQVMGVLTLEQYQRVIDLLARAGVIEVKQHEIIWKVDSTEVK